MIKNLIRLGIFAALLAACNSGETSYHQLGLYSRYLLSDTTVTDFRILSSCGKYGRMGKIYVLGEPEEVLEISSYLLTSDHFNNINGRNVPDGLVDFAGEDFCAVLDNLHTPYANLLSGDMKDSLIAASIRNFIAAVDSTYYLNIYDIEKLGRKIPAKMVVLASAPTAAYGYFDIDSLCDIAGCNVRLITPLHAMLDQSWAQHGKGLNLAVWTSDSTGLSGVYAEVMAHEKRLRADDAADYTVIFPDAAAPDAMSAFLDFMRKYRSSKADKKLSSIIVDDWDADITALREAAESVKTLAHDSLITYKSLMQDDFDIIGKRDAVVKACFRQMREHNLFTHRISYPTVETYHTEASRSGSFMLVGGKDNSK